MENCNFEILETDSIDINGTVIDLHTVPKDKLEKMRARYERKAGSEEDWLTDGYYTAAFETIERVIENQRANPELAMTAQELFDIAKQSQVGDTVVCPQCKTKFEKHQVQQVFCSNSQSKHGGNCKDRYWNRHDETRKDRMKRIHEKQYS